MEKRRTKEDICPLKSLGLKRGKVHSEEILRPQYLLYIEDPNREKGIMATASDARRKAGSERAKRELEERKKNTPSSLGEGEKRDQKKRGEKKNLTGGGL